MKWYMTSNDSLITDTLHYGLTLPTALHLIIDRNSDALSYAALIMDPYFRDSIWCRNNFAALRSLHYLRSKWIIAHFMLSLFNMSSWSTKQGSGSQLSYTFLLFIYTPSLPYFFVFEINSASQKEVPIPGIDDFNDCDSNSSANRIHLVPQLSLESFAVFYTLHILQIVMLLGIYS